MRIRVIADAAVVRLVASDVEVIVLTPPNSDGASAANENSSAVAYVWDANPNIPLGSPVHLSRLAYMFGVRSDTILNRLSFFTVRWTSGATQAHAKVWAPAQYVNPSLTMYQLALKENAVLYLTNRTHNAMLVAAAASASPDGATPPHVPFSQRMWLPMKTAALRFTSLGSHLRVVGAASRRVWRQDKGAEWTTSAAAVGSFPPSTYCLPASTSSGWSSDDSSSATSSSSEHIFHWGFRVSYADVAGKRVVRDSSGALWPQLVGEDLFVGTNAPSRRRGASVMQTAARRMSVLQSKQTKQEEDDHDNSSEDDYFLEEEDSATVGLPLPAVLLGFGIRQRVEYVIDAASASADVLAAAPKGQKLYECSELEDAVCVLDLLSGGLYANQCSAATASTTDGYGSACMLPIAFAEAEDYEYTVGSSFTFAVDVQHGALNILQNNTVVCVATLPSTFTEAIACAIENEMSDGNSSGVAVDYRTAVMTVIAPVVQIATQGGLVDLY